MPAALNTPPTCCSVLIQVGLFTITALIGTPPSIFLFLLSRKCAKVRTFLFLPRRVLPSYLTGVTFPTTAGMVPDAVPPLLAGLATGRAVSVASRFRFIEVAVSARRSATSACNKSTQSLEQDFYFWQLLNHSDNLPHFP